MIRLRAGDSVAAMAAAVRAAGDDAVIVVIDADVSALDRATMLAAVAPLALEIAPTRRLFAIELTEAHNGQDLAALIEFLSAAEAMTGQSVRL